MFSRQQSFRRFSLGDFRLFNLLRFGGMQEIAPIVATETREKFDTNGFLLCSRMRKSRQKPRRQ